jgi:hypothetical protein
MANIFSIKYILLGLPVLFVLASIVFHLGRINQRQSLSNQIPKEVERNNIVPKEITKGKRKVFLHVGPHKTGSTHVHTYLDKISKQLPSLDFCWPVPRGNIQQSNFLPFHFISNRTVQAISLQWLKACTDKSKHLIISAEAFDRFSEENFNEFRNYLSQYDEFQVIILYREWLNHMYSLYTEIHKYTSRSLSFSEYLLKNFDVLEDIQMLNVPKLISVFSSVVGEQNIRLLDYYGIMAAGKDEAYVIVCEIMGILCKESEYLNQAQLKENKKPEMIPTEIFQLVRNYAIFLGCKVGGNGENDRGLMTTLVEQYRDYSNLGFEFPLLTSNLKILQSHAKSLDSRVRKQYSKVLWYNNETASNIAIEQFKITTLSPIAFHQCEKCMEWLQREVQRQIQLNRFVNCTIEMKDRSGNEIKDQIPSVVTPATVPHDSSPPKTHPLPQQHKHHPSSNHEKKDDKQTIMDLRKKISDELSVSDHKDNNQQVRKRVSDEGAVHDGSDNTEKVLALRKKIAKQLEGSDQ